ncbi:MAG: NAD-dependent epimerase/dehydratase family protein [Ignavibacteria bacterium]|jgi:nucleoside-diphosphate-sugar epimerase
MKSILITGVNGFLGSNLAYKLSKNYKIIGLEHPSTCSNKLPIDTLKYYYYNEGIQKDIFIENEIFAVLHAATVYGRGNSVLDNLLHTNILLPVSIYELANKYNTKLFLNTDTFFNNEKRNYEYLENYTLSKKHALDWLRLIRDKCKIVNMKIFHMYGPNDSPSKFIPQMINLMIKNKKQIELTAGEQKRDFIYIDDVVRAYEIVLSNYEKIAENYKEYQLGTGVSITIKELISFIKKASKSKSKLIFGALPYRKNEIMDSIANNEELIRLGWQSTFSVQKGIKEILNSINKK